MALLENPSQDFFFFALKLIAFLPFPKEMEYFSFKSL